MLFLLEKHDGKTMPGIRKLSWMLIMKGLTMHSDKLNASRVGDGNDHHTRLAGDVLSTAKVIAKIFIR